jgi:flagellar M-ring protein FliF
MNFIASLTNQLGSLLQSQSAARRLTLFLILCGSVAAMIWLSVHARTGGYVVLCSDLRPGEAGEAMSKLREIGIPSQVENGGTAIKVQRAKADDAAMALAMEGIPDGGRVGFELMDKSTIGQTRFQQEKNFHRMREGELARTLLSLREIENARVHLALPEDSLFVSEAKPPTASVVLKLRRGAVLTGRQVNGITHLVSRSVEGLKPENVSIIDSQGNLLNQARTDDAAEFTATQQAYKTQYEDLLKNRIESMLENVIGKGKVSARVQAEFDFSTMHQIKESYDPELSTIKTQKYLTEGTGEKSAGALGIGGVAGSASNVPPLAPLAQAGETTATGTGQGLTKTEVSTEYAPSKTWEESQQTVPVPQRLSVAVLVDGTYEEVKSGKGEVKQEFQPRPQAELDQFKSLVEAAIGFTSNEKRQDTVTVACASFKTDTPKEEKEPFLLTYPVRQMIQLGVEWGVIGVVGLLLILMVLRPAIKQMLVMPISSARGALPGFMGERLTHHGEHPAALSAGRSGGARGLASPEGEADQDAALDANYDAMLNDLSDIEIPEELKGNQEAIRTYKLQRLAARQAKLTQAQAQKMQKEMVDTARNNPQKTVSLLRQWMDEA